MNSPARVVTSGLEGHFSLLRSNASGLRVDSFLANVTGTMRVGWKEVVEPLWEDIKARLAAEGEVEGQLKDTDGYKEVFTSADTEMSERLLIPWMEARSL